MKHYNKNPFEYSYCQSFRNVYHYQNTPITQQSPTTQQQRVKNAPTLTLQYETIQSENHLQETNVLQPRKLSIPASNKNQQFSLSNYSQRLHSNHNKYSSSRFIKQSKFNNCQRKSSEINLPKPKDSFSFEKGMKGVKKLNNQALKTFYKSFRNDPNLPIKKLVDSSNGQSMRIFSQRQMMGGKSFIIQNFIIKSSKKSLKNEVSSNNTNKQKHFFKTAPYDKKFISRATSAQRQISPAKTQRLKQTSKNYCYIQMRTQQHSMQHRDTYLRGEKCLIFNKNKNFAKDCYDFKELLLKNQEKRQKKKKQSQKEADILMSLSKQKQIATCCLAGIKNEQNDKKYVSQMREKKRLKTNITSCGGVEDECLRNDIKPW